MTPKNFQDLEVLYPYQFAGPIISASIARGWFPLFTQLCADIDRTLGPDKRGFHWRQVKEKFGQARLYFQLAEGEHEKYPALMKQLMDLKHEVEAASGKMCAYCGQPGKVEGESGWMISLCKEHRLQLERGELPPLWT